MEITYQPLPPPVVKLSIEGRIILPSTPQGAQADTSPNEERAQAV